MSVLENHFKINENNKYSDTRAVIKGKNYRFTVLSESLLRLEYDESGTFKDSLTEQVSNRNFPFPKFKVEETENILSIITDYFVLEYQKEKPFIASRFTPDANLHVKIFGTEKSWYYNSDEVRNFSVFKTELDTKKEYKTISEKMLEEQEEKKKKSKLNNLLFSKLKRKSLFSLDGYASIDDTDSILIDDQGYMVKNQRKTIDIYLFVYKDDFNRCITDYMMLTGYPPLLPRYALGVWWYKETPYTFEDISNLLVNFNKYGIPLNVLLLGQNWHYKDYHDITKFKSGFTFNRNKLGDMVNFTKYVHDRGVRIGVNIDPSEGIYPHEERYREFATALGIQENQIIPFNAFNKELITAYLEKLLYPIHINGIDFTWIDYKTSHQNQLTALNYYHTNFYKRFQNNRGLVISRISGLTPHKYYIQYSGENSISWDILKKLPEYTSSCANLGLSWISHDIGGFKNGIEEEELYIRYVQLGCFSPILRFASDTSKYYKREPWRWDIKTLTIVKDYLLLRNRLLLYLYSENYKYHKYGTSLIRPIYYDNPSIIDEVDYKNEYYFGSELLIAPITSKKDDIMQRAVERIYLPKGVWYDFKTGKKFIGDKRYVMFFKDEDYPIFARSGSIICLQDLAKNLNFTPSPSKVEIHIFPGTNNIYNVYEDDGVSALYQEGFYILTRYDYNYLKNNYTLIIRPMEGKSGIIPDRRDYKIRFRNTKNAEGVQVMLEGAAYHFEAYVEDNDFIVEIIDVPTIKQVTIICQGQDIEIDATRIINEDIDSIISDLEIPVELKEQVASIMFNDKDYSDKRIAIKQLKRKGLDELFVRMFLRLLEYTRNL